MTNTSKTIERMQDLDLKGKRVLIREDLNVPVKMVWSEMIRVLSLRCLP